MGNWCREHILFYIVKALFHFLSWLPLRGAHLFGALVGRCMWYAQDRSTKITLRNIGWAFPELSSKAQRELAQQSLIATAQTGAEIAQAWLWPREKSLRHIVRVENEGLFDEALASQKGVIVLAPHLGNWEWFNIYLASKTAMTALYEPAKSGPLDLWIRQRREKSSGSHMVPTTREGIVALYKTLQQGGCVGILPDQEPEASGGEFAPFFGIETLSMTLAARLAQKTGAIVLCGFAKRLPNHQGFSVIFNKTSDAIYDKDMRVSVAAMNESVEKAIRLAVDQYQWEYNRFKKAPQNIARKKQKYKNKK